MLKQNFVSDRFTRSSPLEDPHRALRDGVPCQRGPQRLAKYWAPASAGANGVCCRRKQNLALAASVHRVCPAPAHHHVEAGRVAVPRASGRRLAAPRNRQAADPGYRRSGQTWRWAASHNSGASSWLRLPPRWQQERVREPNTNAFMTTSLELVRLKRTRGQYPIPARPTLHHRPNANRISIGWAPRAKRRAKRVCCTSVRVGFASAFFFFASDALRRDRSLSRYLLVNRPQPFLRGSVAEAVSGSRIRWVSPGGHSPQKASGQSYWNSFYLGGDAVTSV